MFGSAAVAKFSAGMVQYFNIFNVQIIIINESREKLKWKYI
jgi:hypothetical protein